MNEAVSVSTEELRQGIIDFLQDYSIETTPHDTKKIDQITEELPAGTRIYVAHPPGSPIDDVVAMSIEFKQRSLTPVPHIIARKLSSRDQLAGALEALQAADIDQALVIAGDIAVENNAYESSLEVLETGLFSEYGFREVGVAGHPEGSKAIGEARVAEAIEGKSEFAKTAPFKLRLVTQFGFDAEAVAQWEAATGESGIDLPIHVGMAGPASLRQLAKFAAMCGVGASARMLMTRTGATANLLRTQAPDNLITYFGRHQLVNPSTRIIRAHFFAFGGVVKCARWVNTVRSGEFELNAHGTGFEITADA